MKKDNKAHVIGREAKTSGMSLDPRTLDALRGSICAQDLFQNLNTDQDNPDFDVSVRGVELEGDSYTVSMNVTGEGKGVARVSITRQTVY